MSTLYDGIEVFSRGDNKVISFQTKDNRKGELSFNGSTFTFDKGLNAELEDLATHLGDAPTPLTRTNNPIVGANTPNANIDALDAAIGENGDMSENADAQLKIISRGYTVMANLEALDNRKTVNTVAIRVGGVGVANCDENFATAANTTEQVITLCTLPALVSILEVATVTEATFTGATTLVAEIGTTSSGHEIMDSTTIYAADAINQVAADHKVVTAAMSVDTKTLYLAATPGANWSGVTAGTVVVYVTYIDVSNT